LSVVVLAVVGAAASLYWLGLNSAGPYAMVKLYGYRSTQPGIDASLTVEFFGWVKYTRKVPAAAFDAEFTFWGIGITVLVVSCGALSGGLIGYWAGRWLRRMRRGH
jgi:hypothetical protein